MGKVLNYLAKRDTGPGEKMRKRGEALMNQEKKVVTAILLMETPLQ